MATTNEVNQTKGLTAIKDGANALINEVSRGLIGREEESLVGALAILTKTHASFIGEAGLGKSLIIRRLASSVDANYYEYLMTKYTVPDEIVGSIDPIEYQKGKYTRMTKGTIIEGEVAFIDEIFKGSSDTLNALLTIMNERVYADPSGFRAKVPLMSLFGASNEYPNDPELAPFYDRFTLKHYMKRISSDKLETAIQHVATGNYDIVKPVVNKQFVEDAYKVIGQYMVDNIQLLSKETSKLVELMRGHGLFVSDRTAISYLPRMITTHFVVKGGSLQKSAIAVSKYLLPNNEDALESYKNALNDLYPPEIREAQTKLEQAREKATSGQLGDAKKLSAEAVQLAQSLFSKPEKMNLFKTELNDLIKECEDMVRDITQFEVNLKKFGKGGQ